MDESDRAAAHRAMDDLIDRVHLENLATQPEAFSRLPPALRDALVRWAEWSLREKRAHAHLQLDQHLDASDAMYERDITGATRH
jgi:hypothetical protein